MDKHEQYNLEAERIALYLVGKSAGDRERRIYAEAMRRLDLRLDAREEVLWQKMLRSRTMMGWVDAGLVLLKPASPLRRKLFTMLAILEASPSYTRDFLSRPFPPYHLLRLAVVCVRAVGRSTAGVAILKLTGNA